MVVKKSMLEYFSQIYQGGFGPPPLAELVKIPDQLVQVYVSWRTLTIIGRMKKFRPNNMKSIVTQYRPGRLQYISNKYNVPPLWLLKRLARTRQEKLNDAKLSKDLRFAVDNDISSAKWLRKESTASKDFEDRVGQWLTEHKILYIDEEKLKEEQIREYGRAIATPDFLLKKPIVISGQTIHWIDAKNYILFDSFLLEHVKKQAQRYNNLFGNGALIFSMGVVENVTIPSTLVLDAREILGSQL